MLYFAYGSNMPTKRIYLSDPDATFEGVAELRGYRLDFTWCSQTWKAGAADVIPSIDDSVWGVLWEVTDSGLVKLDKREGVKSGAYKRKTVVVSRCGAEINCTTYVVACKRGPFLPSSKYLDHLVSGALEHNLPANYVTKLCEIRTADNAES